MGEIVPIRIDESPQVFSPEAEQQVLGALLLNNSAISVAMQHGGPRLFRDPVHGLIFKRILENDKAGILSSPVTLADWAGRQEGIQELGGSKYLARMAACSVSSSLMKDYCQHLSELASRRDLLEIADAARQQILSGDVPAAQAAAAIEAGVAQIEDRKTAGIVSMMGATTEAVRRIMAAHSGDDSGAVKTGIPPLDRLISGLYPGELIVLGGRPSMGKTSVALNICLNVARAGSGVAFASLEMTPDALSMRALSEQMSEHGSAVAYRDLRSGQFPDETLGALKAAARDIAELPIFMLPREYSDTGALFAGCKRAKAALGGDLGLVVVDYIQLMNAADSRSRYEIITKVSSALKGLAMRLGVPVLALSQLSRQVEQREDKRPMLSDLRESGQIEQDADAVLFCYRDEYYLEREQPEGHVDASAHADWEAEMRAAHNRLEIIVAKQRQGPIGTAKVMCNVALNRIWEG